MTGLFAGVVAYIIFLVAPDYVTRDALVSRAVFAFWPTGFLWAGEFPSFAAFLAIGTSLVLNGIVYGAIFATAKLMQRYLDGRVVVLAVVGFPQYSGHSRWLRSRYKRRDICFTFRYGASRYRGGPMMSADLIGLPKVLEAVKGYEQRVGKWWKPAALLEKLAAEGRGFNG